MAPPGWRKAEAKHKDGTHQFLSPRSTPSRPPNVCQIPQATLRNKQVSPARAQSGWPGTRGVHAPLRRGSPRAELFKSLSQIATASWVLWTEPCWFRALISQVQVLKVRGAQCEAEPFAPQGEVSGSKFSLECGCLHGGAGWEWKGFMARFLSQPRPYLPSLLCLMGFIGVTQPVFRLTPMPRGSSCRCSC